MFPSEVCHPLTQCKHCALQRLLFWVWSNPIITGSQRCVSNPQRCGASAAGGRVRRQGQPTSRCHTRESTGDKIQLTSSSVDVQFCWDYASRGVRVGGGAALADHQCPCQSSILQVPSTHSPVMFIARSPFTIPNIPLFRSLCIWAPNLPSFQLLNSFPIYRLLQLRAEFNKIKLRG